MSKLSEPRHAFHPIEADLDDAVDQLAQRKGIPTLTAPEMERVVAKSVMKAGLAASAVGEKREPAPAALGLPEARKEQAADPPAQEIEYTSVKCRCPDYLLDQLHLVARRGRVTISHLILEALRAQGFFIREEDMVPDGRRIRGSRTR